MAKPKRLKRWSQSLPREQVASVAGYSNFVNLMRRVLPVVALLLGFVIIIWPSFDNKNVVAPPVPGVAQREMLSPRYSGVDSKGQPFSVTAVRAAQPEASVDVIMLYDLVAEMKGADGAWSKLSAKEGRYDRSAGTLDLAEAVHVQNHQGYDVLTDEAHVKLKEGRAEGQKPVAGVGPMGKINGAGFRIEDSGKTITFTGRPKLELKR